MLQELFARALDEMSYLYMGSQLKKPNPAAAICSLEEFLDQEGSGDDIHAFFKNPGYVPDLKLRRPVKRRRYNVLRFKFKSPVYTFHKANEMVRGRLYDRHGEPDATMTILLHGWRMDSYMIFDRFARLLIHEGCNCAMPDLPYHMSRTPGGSFAGEFTFKDDVIHTLETLRQALFDVMSVINWAKEVRGVKRIGVMGVSFGAMLTGLLACLEPQVDFAVMVAPPVDFNKMFSGSRLGKMFEKENPRAEKMIRLYNETLQKISLQNLQPLVPKENIFIAEGIYDGMVPPPLVEDLWAAWGHPEIRRYPQGHLSVILFNRAFEHDLRIFLHSVLQDKNA